MRRMRVALIVIVPAGLVVAGGAYFVAKRGAVRAPSAAPAATPPATDAVPHAEEESYPGDRAPASEEEGTERQSECRPLEYAGRGPASGGVSTREWNKIMDEFHDLKKAYQGWLDSRRGEVSEKTAAELSDRLKKLRIQRPPTPAEPDLSWRGIGAHTYDEDGGALVRIGDGFSRLLKRDPGRARFELARLIAQTWAPCELKKAGLTQPWNELSRCLGIEDAERGCAAGAYSEAGWAVSSALAAQVAKPGCRVPAFASAKAQSCIWKMPMGAAKPVREASR